MTSLNDWLESTSLLEHPEVKHQIDRVRSEFENFDAQARKIIQERPVLAVGAALLVGYTLARLFRSR